MSIWVRALCPRSVGDVEPADLVAGIAERLALLTYLYCPEDEEPPDEVRARLRIEPLSASADRVAWALHYRTGRARGIRVERWIGSPAAAEAQELRAQLDDADGSERDLILSILLSVTEVVAFELAPSDAKGMGWPVAIGGAAFLAQRGGGLVQADGEGWLAPDGREVRALLHRS